MAFLSKHDVFDAIEQLFGKLPRHTTKVVLTLDFNNNEPPKLEIVSLPYDDEDIVDPSSLITQRFKLEAIE